MSCNLDSFFRWERARRKNPAGTIGLLPDDRETVDLFSAHDIPPELIQQVHETIEARRMHSIHDVAPLLQQIDPKKRCFSVCAGDLEHYANGIKEILEQ